MIHGLHNIVFVNLRKMTESKTQTQAPTRPAMLPVPSHQALRDPGFCFLSGSFQECLPSSLSTSRQVYLSILYHRQVYLSRYTCKVYLAFMLIEKGTAFLRYLSDSIILPQLMQELLLDGHTLHRFCLRRNSVQLRPVQHSQE